MAKQDINIGTTANDGTGDQLRDAFDKVNDNIAEIYGTGDEVTDIISIADMNAGAGKPVRTTAPVALTGAASDEPGMIALDADSIYVCVAAYDGVSDIWIQLNRDATIDHDTIANVGSNDHAAIDTHIAATDIHYTMAEMRDAGVMTSVPTLPHGVAGDVAGMISADASYLYVCILDYVDDATVSWHRIALPAPTNATTW